MNIIDSTAKYEAWLKKQLGRDFVAKDIEEKHDKMAEDAFQFLRATYWRWAETILEVCPDLVDRRTPQVLAVGDIHLENYGVWRDAEGRLVWGVNDFDEAAEMPYVLDLVRLATSTVLAPGSESLGPAKICKSVLEGYRDGLKDPEAFVLDKGNQWLRKQFSVTGEAREAFWEKLKKEIKDAKKEKRKLLPDYERALKGAMLPGTTDLIYWPKAAGTGSLGRARWRARGEWCGAPIVREAKRMATSGWVLARGSNDKRIRAAAIAAGKYRAADPWYVALHSGRIAVRRLSPNSRKLEIEEEAEKLLNPKMLRKMGQDLANVHLGVVNKSKAIAADLDARKRRWLEEAVDRAAVFITGEQSEWKKLWKKTHEKAKKARR